MSLKDKVPADAKPAREKSLAEALRANLRRRKAVDRATNRAADGLADDAGIDGLCGAGGPTLDRHKVRDP